MKTHRKLIILFLFLACVSNINCLFLTSVGSSGAAGPTQPASAVERVADEKAEEEGAAQIVEGPLAGPAFSFPSLGSIAFDVNASETASADYLPGQETVIELTDSNGLTWRLPLPMDALLTAQTITITALANARSQDVPGSLAGGLMFEPDGLEFLSPALLSVSGDGAVELPFLLTGQHDGTGVEIAFMEEAPGTALIYHFSTIFVNQADDEKTLEELYTFLVESEKAVTQEAKALLKNPNIPVPIPPSTPLECTNEEQAKEYAKLIDDFMKAANQPEGDLIGRLLTIKRGKALLGHHEAFTLENRLLTRLVKKARLLIKTYYGQEEKLDAVAHFALQVSREVSLLSENPSSTDAPLFLEEISSWSASLIDPLLKDIRTEHDYRKVNAVWKMAYWASLLGGQVKPVEEILASLERVFRFQMKLKYQFGIEGESKYQLEGEFPMRFVADKTRWGTLTGSGSANLTLAEFDSDEDWYVVSKPFQVNAIITGFDVCGATAYLTVDRFYPDVENHFTKDSEGQDMEIGPMNLIQISWDTLFDDRKKTGLSWFSDGEMSDQYTFKLNLRNKDVTAVYDSIESIDVHPDGTLAGWFDVELTHTPK